MYIHYGAKAFDRTKFAPIKNRTCGSKPFGGLWASPVDAKFGWKEWNDIEEFRTCDPKNAFRFTLAEGARVLRIDSLDKLSEIPVNKPAYHFDFEDVAKRYDAVECCLSEAPALYNALYGWDCDSILVLNQDVIVPVPDEAWNCSLPCWTESSQKWEDYIGTGSKRSLSLCPRFRTQAHFTRTAPSR